MNIYERFDGGQISLSRRKKQNKYIIIRYAAKLKLEKAIQPYANEVLCVLVEPRTKLSQSIFLNETHMY